jgi:oligopeptide/dipeptide ABC transporter ATP-binding protein
MSTREAWSSSGTGEPLLRVRDLVTRFHTHGGVVHAVNGVGFELRDGESLALVGESGSGKSVTALSVLGLVPRPGRIEGGEIRYQDRDLRALRPKEWQEVRGREIGMVFQDPMTSLNPVLTIGRQITEVLRWHLRMGRNEARDRAVELLELVGIPSPERRLDEYPHQFSGGQRQRILIAIALAAEPRVLIADEPTTALDVTIQAQIVELIKGLQQRLGMAILWITHDLALVAGMVDRVAVMYAGQVVEEAPVGELFRAPRHPYTRALLRSMPTMGERDERLPAIPGKPPVLHAPPAACPFAPRCAFAGEECRTAVPTLDTVSTGHRVACFRWEEAGRE